MSVEPMDDTPQDNPVLGSWGGSEQAPPVGEVEYGVTLYFGKPIRVVLDPLSLELSFEEFMDLAASLDSEEDVRSVGAVRTFLRSMIHPLDFREFWRLVKANRQGIEEQMAFGKWVVEQVTGHPTERPSNSGTGRSQTSTNSEADASWRVQHRLEAQGRPDLALMVVHKREHDALAQTG